MLKTNFLGMQLKNPLIIAAGPWNRDGASLRESIAAGAGAVVTESIVSDTMMDVGPRIACDDSGAQNIRLYSDIQVEGWQRELEIAKSDGGIVIASVSAQTPSEVAYLASKLERFGADAVELSVSNPMLEGLEVVASHAETIYEMTQAMVASVKIPVIVKLSQNTTNIAKVAKAAKEAGASCVSAINTVRGILGVDLENARPMLSTYGGVSGDYIRPMALASVATISQTVDIPVSGIGGISTGRHALEYIMLGASTVQVGTAVMLQGRQVIPQILREMEQWMKKNKCRSIDEIRGRALANLKSFDEMKYEPFVSTVTGVPCQENCSRCVDTCMYGAITKAGGAASDTARSTPAETAAAMQRGGFSVAQTVKVDRGKCVGCGLCTFVCPRGKLSLGL